MMMIANYCLYLYLLLKPYYIIESGNLQISDLFIIPALILIVIYNYRQRKEKVSKGNIEKNKILKNRNFLLLVFVFYACLINAIYYYIYRTPDFVEASLQLIFILVGIYTFQFAFKQKEFVSNLVKIFQIDLVFQFLILVLGIGRDYDTARYMGTFNDPNQFAFFVFLAITFIHIGKNILNLKKSNLVYHLIAIILIFKSASVGMFMGLGILYSLMLVLSIIKHTAFIRRYYRVFIVAILGLIIVATVLNFLNIDILKSFRSETGNISIIERMSNKINSFFITKEGPSFFEERGYDKIFKYPHYLLFGSGYGNYERFVKASHLNEIHSTIPSIFFAYGIIPTLILIKWLYENLKKSKFIVTIAYIAVLVESFTLVNQRQLLLWALVVLPATYLLYNKAEEGVEESSEETESRPQEVFALAPVTFEYRVKRAIYNFASIFVRQNRYRVGVLNANSKKQEVTALMPITFSFKVKRLIYNFIELLVRQSKAKAFAVAETINKALLVQNVEKKPQNKVENSKITKQKISVDRPNVLALKVNSIISNIANIFKTDKKIKPVVAKKIKEPKVLKQKVYNNKPKVFTLKLNGFVSNILNKVEANKKIDKIAVDQVKEVKPREQKRTSFNVNMIFSNFKQLITDYINNLVKPRKAKPTVLVSVDKIDSKKQKIAMFIPTGAFGGVQQVVTNLANGFVGHDKQVYLIVADGRGNGLSKLSDKVVVVDLKVTRSLGDYKTILSFFRLVKVLFKIKPNILLAAPGFATVIAIIAKFFCLARFKTVVMVDNRLSLLMELKTKHKISYHLYKFFYKFANMVVVAHREAGMELLRTFRINSKKVKLVYHPVVDETNIYRIKERPEHRWFKEGKDVILAAGRLVKEKDFATLIRAFRKFNLAYDEKYHLLILGEGPERDDLQSLINRLGLSSKVDLYGHTDEPLRFMKYSKLFVLSSVKEAFGNVIVEALSMGIPVVATDCNSGGPREILATGKYGKLTECSNVNKLSDAMKVAVEDEVNSEILIRRSYAFGIGHAVESYEKIFDYLTKKRS